MHEQQLTELVIGGFFRVYNDMGYGFLEAPYANALAVELRYLGLRVAREVPIELTYRGVVVGHYRADMVVNEKVLVETKSTRRLVEADELQLLNYLKGSGIKIGLLFNFGTKAEFRRRVN